MPGKRAVPGNAGESGRESNKSGIHYRRAVATSGHGDMRDSPSGNTRALVRSRLSRAARGLAFFEGRPNIKEPSFGKGRGESYNVAQKTGPSSGGA